MALNHLKIRNFRNLTSIDLDLDPGVNLFHGANAQGKTAILEAVNYLATSTSQRTRKDVEMIRWGEMAAYGCVQAGGEPPLQLEFGLGRDSKQFKVDGEVLKRISDLYGRLRVVLFVPEDLEIVSGSPSERRRFIDLTAAQVGPRHIGHLQKYQQCLKSRNQLLKRAQVRRPDPVEMEIWDAQLAEAAIPVIETRRETVREISSALERFYGRLTEGREKLHLRYLCSTPEEQGLPLRESILSRLAASTERDIQNGSTSPGPHRDDLGFVLDGRDLRTFGSQGQRRSSVLALRLAELQWLREKTGQHPVMLIDDVIYEMDETRRNHFFEEIGRGGQVLITATEIGHLGDLAETARLFRVEEGMVNGEW